VQSTNA